MSSVASLFTEMNDENAWALMMQTPQDFLNVVEAGSRWIADESTMANQYAMASGLLLRAAIDSGTPWFYSHPVLFLYRHAIELHLKGILRPSRPTHNLLVLRDSLIEYVKTKYGGDITGGWITETITEFGTLDPSSTRLRYARDNQVRRSFAAEQVVNLADLKIRMDALFQVFMHLKMAQSASPNRSGRI